MNWKCLATVSALTAVGATACGGASGAGSAAPKAEDATANKSPEAKMDDPSPKPTIALIHGAFADSSSWNGVVQRLQQRGYPVIAPPNPLRGIESDAASVASVLKTVQGPIVLAGHSYGGMVISEAAKSVPAVKALVYVAAFLPEPGDSAIGLTTKFPGSKLAPTTTNPVPYATPSGGKGVDTYIKPDASRDVFAADLPASTTAILAATQRPIEGSALGGPFPGTPAWKTIPSWALVARADQAIPAECERFMAARAKARVVEVDASHAVLVSRPDAVADLIVQAAQGAR
ncbi:alpha/beta fold hydrolase [Pendulispora albinea]|uniref:Alpha/beta hydrolase n=1 Tax=Pendulispora albinea TaxID=2741071 RepID=A0ABZ2LYU8_9BACT